MHPSSISTATRTTLLNLAGIALCLTLPAHPQRTSVARVAVPPVTVQTTSNLVQIDVVITDRDTPVPHIDKQRFHLTDDGKEQSITAIDDHSFNPVPSQDNAKTLPPGTYTNRPRYPSSGAVNILLLDGLNTPLPDQTRARLQMTALLAKIPPGTPLALFTLASRLRLVQGFTTDPAAILTQLKASGNSPSAALNPDPLVGPNSLIDDMADPNSPLFDPTQSAVASMQQFQSDVAAFQSDIRVRITVDALQQLARYLNGIPGRKNLLWISGAFPIDLDADPSLTDPFSPMRTYAADLRDTSALFASARVAVYPVDARGLMNIPSFEAAYSGSSGSARRSARNPTPGFAQDNANFLSQTQAEHITMQQLASETGGQAYINTNDLQSAVSHAIQNGSSYYTLSFIPPPNHLDGKFHKLRLRIDGASYHLIYRPGYYADDPAKPSTHLPGPTLMQQATLRGAPQATQLLFEATAVPIPIPTGETAAANLKPPVTRYRIDLHLHPETLSFSLTGDGSRHGQVELTALAYDREGKRLNFVDYGLPVNLKADQYAHLPSSGLPIRTQIDLPSGRVYLRIALRDPQTQKIGSLEIPLNVPKS